MNTVKLITSVVVGLILAHIIISIVEKNMTETIIVHDRMDLSATLDTLSLDTNTYSITQTGDSIAISHMVIPDKEELKEDIYYMVPISMILMTLAIMINMIKNRYL